MNDVLKLGILGGSFDPIHTGHLIIAEISRQQFSLDRVIITPAGFPPHKLASKLASAKDRLEMVKLAAKDNPYLDVCQYETDRDVISYTVDTLKELKTVYPEGTKMYFIIGEDSLMDLKGWKNPSELFLLCTMLVYRRFGLGKKRIFKEIEFLKSHYNAKIEIIQGPFLDVSSTLIRNYAAKQMSLKYIVPDVVAEYIRVNSLYSEVQ